MANGVYIVPDTAHTSTSASIKESNSTFTAPAGQVIVGRMHSGDENGTTCYKTAPLIVDPNQGASLAIKLGDSQWIDAGKESASSFSAPSGFAVIGRSHSGDENGDTKYQIAQVLVNGGTVKSVDSTSSSEIKESSGEWYVSPAIGNIQQVMTGRKHSGDENGKTTYASQLFMYNG